MLVVDVAENLDEHKRGKFAQRERRLRLFGAAVFLHPPFVDKGEPKDGDCIWSQKKRGRGDGENE